MRKFCFIGFMSFLLFTCGGIYSAEKKERKLRFEDYASDYDNEVWYLLNRVLIWGSGWDYTEARMCISSDQPTATGRVWARNFKYEEGNVFPVTANSQFSLSKSGVPFKASVNIPVSSNWTVELGYSQSRALQLEQTDDHDYFQIDTLKEIPVAGSEYNLWEMEFLRTDEENSKTFKFRNFNFDVSIQRNLLPTIQRFSFSPEAGIGFSFLKRTLEGETSVYGYFPTQFPGFFYPDESLDDYRELENTNKIGESDASKLKTRFFIGMNLEYNPVSYLWISCTLRTYHRAIKEDYTEVSPFGDYLFDLKIGQVLFSVGVVFVF